MEVIVKNKKAFILYHNIYYKNIMNKRISKEEFLIRANKVHGKKYDYNKLGFNSVKDKIIITCPLHGDFMQIAHSHLSGRGCSKCAFDKIHGNKILTTDDFIEKSKKIHGDEYDYSLVEYINNITKVTIICPIHGEFKQTPHNHKRGGGCEKCGNIKRGKACVNNSRGWSLTDWENKLKKVPNSKAILYVIECYNGEENFIKVGITMRSIKKRFCNKTLMPYKFKTLLEITDLPNIIFNTEIEIKQQLKLEKYKPIIKFSGCNECFNKSCDKKLIDLIMIKIKQNG